MKTRKFDVKQMTAIGLLLSGVVMAFVALFLPPPGVIDDSVLYLFAQILIYVGSIFGIEACLGRGREPRGLSPRPPCREGASMMNENKPRADGCKDGTKLGDDGCGRSQTEG